MSVPKSLLFVFMNASFSARTYAAATIAQTKQAKVSVHPERSALERRRERGLTLEVDTVVRGVGRRTLGDDAVAALPRAVLHRRRRNLDHPATHPSVRRASSTPSARQTTHLVVQLASPVTDASTLVPSIYLPLLYVKSQLAAECEQSRAWIVSSTMLFAFVFAFDVRADLGASPSPELALSRPCRSSLATRKFRR